MSEKVYFSDENIQKISTEFNLTNEQINEFETEFKAYDKRKTGDFFCERNIISHYFTGSPWQAL